MALANPSGERNIDWALRRAISDGHAKRVDQALALGADPNAHIQGGDLGYRPLAAAVYKWPQAQSDDALMIVKTLLSAGSAVDGALADGARALHYAAGAGWAEATRALLLAGADPSLADASGMAPLHSACAQRPGHQVSVAAVEALIKAGAPVDQPGPFGLTPLHCAAACCRADLISALLAAGADPSLAAKDGRLAEHFVRMHGRAGAEAEELCLQALRAPGQPAPTGSGQPLKLKKSKAEAIDRWFWEQLTVSYAPATGPGLAIPGGQKSFAIDPLSLIRASAHSVFAVEAISAMNQSRAFGGRRVALSVEPGLEAWILPWRTVREEGGMWQESAAHEQRYAFAIPVRGLDAKGAPAVFLALGWTKRDLEKGAALPPAKPPRLSSLPDVEWDVAGSRKEVEFLLSMVWEDFESQVSGLCHQADLSWDLDVLLNPARVEREVIEKATRKAKALARAPGRL